MWSQWTSFESYFCSSREESTQTSTLQQSSPPLCCNKTLKRKGLLYWPQERHSGRKQKICLKNWLYFNISCIYRCKITMDSVKNSLIRIYKHIIAWKETKIPKYTDLEKSALHRVRNKIQSGFKPGSFDASQVHLTTAWRNVCTQYYRVVTASTKWLVIPSSLWFQQKCYSTGCTCTCRKGLRKGSSLRINLCL